MKSNRELREGRMGDMNQESGRWILIPSAPLFSF
jgi:hypothetical protein